MRMKTSTARAAKRPANLSVDSDLLNKARELDINLSATLEEALAAEVRSRQRDLWLAENQEAIAAYNEHVSSTGVWSDGRRGF
jgi:antitoxin CcdA